MPQGAVERHRREIAAFAETVAGDAVAFHSCSYAELLGRWQTAGGPRVAAHAAAIAATFDIQPGFARPVASR